MSLFVSICINNLQNIVVWQVFTTRHTPLSLIISSMSHLFWLGSRSIKLRHFTKICEACSSSFYSYLAALNFSGKMSQVLNNKIFIFEQGKGYNSTIFNISQERFWWHLNNNLRKFRRVGRVGDKNFILMLQKCSKSPL